jgi:hypothetical protein
MLEIGREPVYGGTKGYLLANIADDMIEEAENLVKPKQCFDQA